ncbi:MAG: restriction endonuclease subunit S [Schwartzia sp.]|nr:restriction endonuclease subunit S [Schwartzia sp. (in: firmicutes)]
MRKMKDSGIAWIGEIPEEWGINTVFQLFTQVKNKNSDLQEQNLLSLSYGKIKRKNIETTDGLLPESFDGYNIIAKNDIVLRLTDLQNDQKSLRVGLATERGIVTSAYLTIRNRSNFLATYLYYYLHAFDISKGFYGMGAGVRQGLNWDGIKWLKILSPPLPEQHRIAAFLDDKCAHIDAVIETTRASIDEYKKLKQAIITRAVTKGLRQGRKMKDSGIEWIGEIPQEWEARRIKTLFQLRDERNSLPLEQVNLISLYTDKGVMQHSDIEKTTGNKASHADGYKKVYQNDIVVNIILCWMGAIGRSDYDGVTSPAYDVYIPSEEIDSRFYHHYFRTSGFSGDCYKRGKGIMAMRWRTYSDQFRDIRVVMPPLTEQREILAYLDAKTAAIDRLIAKKEQLIAEMQSCKKSLIYEVVTGKREVL